MVIINLAYSFTLIPSGVNISSPLRHPYLPILPDGNADIFADFLLILHCSFSCLILSSINLIIFCILSRKFFASVVSITKKEYGFLVNFSKDS